jgi:lactoylglutathione lyase
LKFCWATIHVEDMSRSLRFYQEVVGLPMSSRMAAGPGMEIVFLGSGESKVELIWDERVKTPDLGEDISLGFEVPSLDDMMKKVEDAGIELHSGPFQPNPHVRFFYVLDPDGLKVQFVENL